MVTITERNGMRFTNTGETVYSDEQGDYYYRVEWTTLPNGRMTVDMVQHRIGDDKNDFDQRVRFDDKLGELFKVFAWTDVFNGEIFTYWRCDCCGDIFSDDDAFEYGGDNFCPACVDDNFTACARCGELSHIDDVHSTVDGEICTECFDNFYMKCGQCGNYVETRNCISDDSGFGVCRHCWAEGEWFRCDDCGRIETLDNCCSNESGCYCENCYDGHDDCSDYYGIHEYGYRPNLDFKGEGTLFFGTELEIDYGDRSRFKFGELSDHFYCANDGSLSEEGEGFEIISHPMTYEWMMENTPFKHVVALAKAAGFKSHNTDTCGFHVHMTRDAFGAARDEAAENRITSFIFFFEKFWTNIAKFSRRNNFGYAERICADGEQITYEVVDAKKKTLGWSHEHRYHCVNITNHATIEVRVFRGSLNENTLIAAVQLCKLFYELSVFDVATIETMTWEQIKEYAVTDYPELLTYMKEREL